MKSPAFRFYPGDFWASPDVQAMDLHEVGAYLSLMCNAWLSDQPGRLPDDDEKLRRWARMTRAEWEQSRATLLAKFPLLEDGWRENPRLFHEAEKQEAFSAVQSAKGKRGGRPKAGEKPGLSNVKPGLSSGLSPEKPSVSVSVSVKNKDKDAATVPVARGTLLVELPLKDGAYEVREDDLERARRTFPGMDHEAEFRKMASWSENATAADRKTKKGVGRFISGWLGRAYDDRHKQMRGMPAAQPRIIYTDLEALNAR